MHSALDSIRHVRTQTQKVLTALGGCLQRAHALNSYEPFLHRTNSQGPTTTTGVHEYETPSDTSPTKASSSVMRHCRICVQLPAPCTAPAVFYCLTLFLLAGYVPPDPLGSNARHIHLAYKSNSFICFIIACLVSLTFDSWKVWPDECAITCLDPKRIYNEIIIHSEVKWFMFEELVQQL